MAGAVVAEQRQSGEVARCTVVGTSAEHLALVHRKVVVEEPDTWAVEEACSGRWGAAEEEQLGLVPALVWSYVLTQIIVL